MIAYKKTNGQAHDLRFVENDYMPEKNEYLLNGDRLPDIQSLHDSNYIDAINKEQQENAIKDKLQQIDFKSIRSIREWLAKQTDGPEFIKALENEAITERKKLTT